MSYAPNSVASLLSRQLNLLPLCAETKNGISRNSGQAGKLVRLIDEERRTKDEVGLDRQLSCRPFQLDIE